MSYLENFLITLFISIAAALIVYIIKRRKTPAIWAYIASWMLDFSQTILAPLGAKNLFYISLLSHTAGIFIFPIILVILDILLIELRLLRYLNPFKRLLPQNFKILIKIEHIVYRFQKYHTIPTPTRVKTVYLVSVFAGIFHLLINIILSYFGFPLF